MDIAKCREASWNASYSQDPDEIDEAIDYFSKNCYWMTDDQLFEGVSTPYVTSTPLPPTKHPIERPPASPSLVLPPWSSPTPFPTIVVTPTPTLQPRDLLIPTPTWIPTVTPVPTPTSIPTATPIPTPTPVPFPCKSKACGQGYLSVLGDDTTKVVTQDLWPDITVGERQLAGFIAECELTGVGYREPSKDGDRRRYRYLGGNISGYPQHLPDEPSGDLFVMGLNPWGPVWQDREWWFKEEKISIDGSGAYREGGSCLLVSVPGTPLFEHGDSLKVRLVPRGDTTLSPDQLEFGEGYHYISDETGYDGIYDVEMWWEDPNVLPEDRKGKVILFHFLSYGPGRRDMNAPPLDPKEVERGAWNWCCSEDAKKTRERLLGQ